MAITKVSPDLLDLDAGITISVADNSDNLTLTSTDADANVGPNLRMYRNSSSPADSDVIAAIDFDGRNDNSQDVQYAQIIGQVYDVSDGTEDAALYLQTMVGGTTRERITLKPTESVFNEAGIDLDFRVESDTITNALFVDGALGNIGIGATPKVTEAGWTNVSIGGQGALINSTSANAGGRTQLSNNVYVDESGNYSYISTDEASLYKQINGIHSWHNAASGSADAHITMSERMCILASGFVGIGTSAPHEMLHVEGSDGTQALVAVREDTATATASYMFKVDSTGTDVRKKAGLIFQRDDPGTRGTGVLHICVDGANDEGSAAISDSVMAFPADGTVLTKGNLYISGETSAFSAGSHNGNLLQVNGQSLSSRAAVNNQTHKNFYNGNGAVGSITTDGSATAFNTSSDYRLKENVVTDWDGTTLLKQLKPSKFNFIADADTTLQGFLAHEVSSIVPQAVTGEKDAVYSAEDVAENIGAVEGQPNYQSIDHSKLVPLLVKTIQELEARITTLEGE